MKYSKAFTLLRGLPAKQLNRLRDGVKTHKRKTLQKLFTTLVKSIETDEPLTEEVYKGVFGKKYNKKDDYLLRNEYRLLYDWLSEQIRASIPGTEADNTLLTLTYLLDNSLYELFEDEYKDAWKAAVQADNVNFLAQLSELNIRYYLDGKTQSLPNAEQSILFSSQRISLLQLNALRQIRAEEIRLRMSERVVSAYKETEPVETTLFIDLERLEEGDLYSQYLSKRARINSAKGAAKIVLLKDILKNEEVIRKYEAQPDEAICRFWLNLAQEYYLSSEFSEAVKYYRLAEPQLHSLPLPLQETFLLNYVLALIRNENFDEARELSSANAELMLNSKILSGRSPFLLAVLNLYARDAESAEEYVQLDARKEGSEFYFFMRLVLSAVYYLRGQIELAVRESINIDQAVNYELNREQTLQTRISKPIVALFKRFYTIVQTSLKEDLKKELEALLQELEESFTPSNDQSPNSILTQWLAREINLMVKGR